MLFDCKRCVSAAVVPALVVVLVAVACTPAEKSLWTYCSDVVRREPPANNPAPTYHSDVRAIVHSKCVRCHEPGGMGPFSLRTYDELDAVKQIALHAIEEGHMPPWLGHRCCAEYRDNFGLTDEEKVTFRTWVQAGAPQGDPASASRRPIAVVGGLDRVDLRLTVPEPYAVTPPPGATDDTRCFVIDWPYEQTVYMTGFEVRPGNRRVVHHMVLHLATGKDAQRLGERDREGPAAGFDCGGGAGELSHALPIGGSMGASHMPDGYGVKIPAGAKIIFNIHYSTARLAADELATDQTTVDFRVAGEGKPLNAMVMQNPFWLVGDAMEVKAGDPDAIYYYRARPTVFTAGKRVWIHAVTPHMHNFGKKFVLGILRADGSTDCLLEIPHWHFGWEQFFWLQTPKVLNPDDQVYIECRFDNSEANQPIVDGVRRPPRDIAWGGNDQDMCAGFLTFATEP